MIRLSSGVNYQGDVAKSEFKKTVDQNLLESVLPMSYPIGTVLRS